MDDPSMGMWAMNEWRRRHGRVPSPRPDHRDPLEPWILVGAAVAVAVYLGRACGVLP